MSRRPESARARLLRVLVPGTTGGLYTLACGSAGFLTVLFLYVHSYLSGRTLPDATGELLTAAVTLLGVHTLRGISADRANAANGIAPVPVGGDAGPTQGLPDLRPVDR